MTTQTQTTKTPAARWARFCKEAAELGLTHGAEWIRMDDYTDLVFDGERIEIAESGARCPCTEDTVAAAWLATAKARWEACGALRGRVAFEERYLSIGNQYLSEDAIAVREGGPATAAYYTELTEQWIGALAD